MNLDTQFGGLGPDSHLDIPAMVETAVGSGKMS